MASAIMRSFLLPIFYVQYKRTQKLAYVAPVIYHFKKIN